MKEKEMLQMRIDGATYQEIADAYGITRQRAYQIIASYLDGLQKLTRGRGFPCEDIVYEGMFEYFSANERESLTSFAHKVLGSRGGGTATMRNFLTGRNESHFTIAQIKRMCEIVGKPFEETFKERDNG